MYFGRRAISVNADRKQARDAPRDLLPDQPFQLLEIRVVALRAQLPNRIAEKVQVVLGNAKRISAISRAKCKVCLLGWRPTAPRSSP